MRRLIPFLILLACPVGLAAGDDGEAGSQDGPRWVFTTLPGADLWFHGMALVDSRGPGPNPLYDQEYPERVREAKEAVGVHPTLLDRETGRLREAFRRDPALEVFHFLPLYFSGAGRVEMLEALKLLATHPNDLPRSPSPETAFGLTAIGSVLQRPEQRVLLGEYVALLEAEWGAFLEAHLRGQAQEREAILRSVQNAWDHDFQPSLEGFLRGTGMPGGIVSLTPALGREGRVFAGTPESWRDNVVAVQSPADPGAARNAIYLLIREVTFSMARQAYTRTGMERGRFEEEAQVARGAIRGGALLLEDRLPQEAHGFKEFFLEQGGEVPTAGEVDEAFEQAFPLEPGFLRALREMIEATNNIGD